MKMHILIHNTIVVHSVWSGFTQSFSYTKRPLAGSFAASNMLEKLRETEEVQDPRDKTIAVIISFTLVVFFIFLALTHLVAMCEVRRYC